MINKFYKIFKNYIEYFGLNDKEVVEFVYNFYDAIAFNDYLTSSYTDFDFVSTDYLDKLAEFFEINNISKAAAKKILIKCPLILACVDPRVDLKIIYKAEKISGIIVSDEQGEFHPYRFSNADRFIMQNNALLDDLYVVDDKLDNVKQFNKRFYIKNTVKEVKKR